MSPVPVQRLISLPPGMAPHFEALTGRQFPAWMASSDPEGGVGSGGGTAWILAQAWQKESPHQSFQEWIEGGRRLIIHSGGKSRRLPEFAPQGKVFMPVPPLQRSSIPSADRTGSTRVITRGQRSLTWLLDEIVELGDDLFSRAPARIKVLVLAGDVLLNLGRIRLPDADVSLAGYLGTSEDAESHGVFCPDEAGVVHRMLQKPKREDLPIGWLLDVGVWGLSTRAVDMLMIGSGWTGETFTGGIPNRYDLYSEFGPEACASNLRVEACESYGKFIHLGTTDQFRSFWEEKEPDSPIARLTDLPTEDHPRFFAEQRRKTEEWVKSLATPDRSCLDLRQLQSWGLMGLEVEPSYARLMLRGRREEAFDALRDAIVDHDRILATKPELGSKKVVATAPLRLDLAGGWSDTPPYCLHFGGSVVNLAVEWGKVSPSMATVEPISEPWIEIVSLDRAQTYRLESATQITNLFRRSDLPTIGLAALYLCGFNLAHFFGGFRLTMESRAPLGSGLGASSILAATVLGALNEFLNLKWDKEEIVWRTLCLEQLIGSHGGWQDQAGGIFPGLKLLSTRPGTNQKVEVIPSSDRTLRSNPCLLLYDTGIQRRAFGVLGDIVEGMFLNDRDRLLVLHQIHEHAAKMNSAICGTYGQFGLALRRSWELNQQLDPGTKPPAIQALLDPIDDLIYGGKLLGAGGGGFLLLAAKDEEAAARIKSTWTLQNPAGRFIDWRIADRGLVVDIAK